MKKFFNICGRLFLALMVCSLFLFNGSAEAAKTKGTAKDLAAYKEAVTKPTTAGNAFFNEYFLFFTPMAQCELDFNGFSGKDDVTKMKGAFKFWFTDQNGDTSETDVPFYISHKDKDMTIYFNTGDMWRKFEAPTVAAAAADIVATPNQDETEEVFDMVKSVKVLSETQNYRTMVVKEESTKNPADKSLKGHEEDQDKFFQYLDQGLRNSDIWYTWTIDKNDWQTITLSLNISDLTQKTAQAALDDKSQQWDYTTRALIEMLAYYSDIKSYTVFFNPDAKKSIDIPAEVLNAPSIEDLSLDVSETK